MTDSDIQVQVKFFTKQPQYAIPDTPITVPLNVNRANLSELINRILNDASLDQSTEEQHVQFDFLLGQQFLKTTLATHLEDKGILPETVLEVEYVERQAAPTTEESLEHDDWVSSMQATNGFILSGCYDNTARLWSTKGEAVATISGHSDFVKCVSWIRHDESDPVSSFVTGSDDQTALVWQWNRDTNEVNCCLSCRGHAGCVECVAVSPSGEQMCTVSVDKMLKLWSTAITGANDEDSEEKENPRKKRKSGTVKAPTRVPVLTLSGHTEGISGVQWMDSQKVVTCAKDHSLRIWDMQEAQQTSLLPGAKSFLGVSYSPLSQMFVTGSTDRHVRLYDPRSTDVIVKCSYTSHTNWVTGVSWSPTQEHLFISGSSDSVVKLWDTRSPKAPLYDMREHEDEVLAVDWSVPELMLSGGQDNKLHIFSYTTANRAASG